MKYVGKLLYIKKDVLGFINPPKYSSLDLEIQKGFYLITDSFLDKNSKNLFLEILKDRSLVLLRVKSIEDIGFLC